MSYLPDAMPLPDPTPDERQYWDFCRQKDLRIQKCGACGTFCHPPSPLCPRCRSDKITWAKVSGNGTVFTYTVVHHAADPAVKPALPYNIAVVMLEDADDVRLVSNVIDVAPDDMRIGLPVRLVWEPTRDGGFLPRFRKQTV